ncbi:helix-turn-helix domain-containing protein [Negadavirga shengliensis]|uniref:Helix-turn-helix domain-containing protein n=1 Tax=Negadavirga shengliensis TaxID=1389218 RepID=A0ABV9SWT4_9BACT
MRLCYKYDVQLVCKKIIEQELLGLGIKYTFIGNGELELRGEVLPEVLEDLNKRLVEYGINIINNQRDSLIQKIKETIIEMIYSESGPPNEKTSEYLSKRLHFSYGYLSNLFSEVTWTTIENFIILQKIERAKELLISGNYTLTEIAYKLDYSSVAHLSNQFKKTTGLTPSSFRRIIERRKEYFKSILEETTK